MKQQIRSVIARAVLLASLALAWSAAANAQQFSAWSAPTNLNHITLSDGTLCPAVVNSPFNDNHPTISKDGLSLIFESNRPGGSGGTDLWVTERNSLDDCWQTPKNLGSVVNSAFNDAAPNLTTDGHWLYFHSNRDGAADLYVSHRQDAGDDFGWETPINLGPTINPPGFDQAGPLHFEDDATGIQFLYFTQKPTPPPSIQNNNLFDIYVSACASDLATCNTQGLWGQGTPVVALNSPFRDTRTAIRRRDGLEMIISTGRPGSLLSENLWVSTRPVVTLDQENWATPEPLNCDHTTGFISPNTGMFVPCSPWNPQGPLINSDAFDGAPALSWDGTELYFFSERTDLPGFAGGRDLYVSKRTKLTGPQ